MIKMARIHNGWLEFTRCERPDWCGGGQIVQVKQLADSNLCLLPVSEKKSRQGYATFNGYKLPVKRAKKGYYITRKAGGDAIILEKTPEGDDYIYAEMHEDQKTLRTTKDIHYWNEPELDPATCTVPELRNWIIWNGLEVLRSGRGSSGWAKTVALITEAVQQRDNEKNGHVIKPDEVLSKIINSTKTSAIDKIRAIVCRHKIMKYIKPKSFFDKPPVTFIAEIVKPSEYEYEPPKPK